MCVHARVRTYVSVGALGVCARARVCACAQHACMHVCVLERGPHACCAGVRQYYIISGRAEWLYWLSVNVRDM